MSQEDATYDRRFNPYRRPKANHVEGVVHEALRLLTNFEAWAGTRKRARRQADQIRWKGIVTGIVCDLIHRELTCTGGGVAISLHKGHSYTSRYAPKAMGKQLAPIIRMMAAAEMGYIEVEPGRPATFDAPARLTTLRAGPRLLNRIQQHSISLSDLRLSPDEEIIVLKREREGHGEAERIEYQDTTQTNAYRQQLRSINEWLEEADVTAVGPIAPDLTDRRLYRYFTVGSFETGGRLFGGFWQRMRKAERNRLRINGEKVATLDYSQMVPRIAYSMARERVPEADAYTIPGLESYRPGIKKVFNALMFASSPLTRFPRGTRTLFEGDIRFSDVLDRIRTLHEPISKLFFIGAGHKAQFIESTILVNLLDQLREVRIHALPIHDAVVIPLSRLDEVRRTMIDTFQCHTGIPGIVCVDM